MFTYEPSSLTAAQASFQARRLPTVRSQTSAGRCRSRQSCGRPPRPLGPRRPSPSPYPDCAAVPWILAPSATSAPAQAPPRDPHPGGAEAAANARPGRSGGDVAPRGAEQRRNLPPRKQPVHSASVPQDRRSLSASPQPPSGGDCFNLKVWIEPTHNWSEEDFRK